MYGDNLVKGGGVCYMGVCNFDGYIWNVIWWGFVWVDIKVVGRFVDEFLKVVEVGR